MTFLKSPLFLRCASAFVLAPAVLTAIWFGAWPFWGMVFLACAIGVYEWLNVAAKTKFDLVVSVIGILYIALAAISFALLREMGIFVILALLLPVWGSDIGAYAAGRLIGGPKMAPAISPNKTWAGLGGAVAAGILALWGLSAVTVFHIPLHFMIFFGAVIALSGQAGDLLVSFLKRKAGVKDTGTLIPGHGGLLDRIDSLLLAAPVFLLLLKVLMK
ncbi:MAG: phosphatidate cytidylyltransferase [Rhodospirillales bacterium]|nr:phosphatidate cytidylyltransferase [Alphaproteobacteria bacterium]USO03299.1 MAG: phosphatidate cytidylyltransferase [Rhodospirillales bacterium]